jgi:Putative lumazine-binding
MRPFAFALLVSALWFGTETAIAQQPAPRASVATAAATTASALAPSALAEPPAATAADSAAIRATALDYVEGWYAGDAERMARALHPELAKRVVRTDPASGRQQLGQMGAMTLVEYTRQGGGREVPADARRRDVRILDVFGDAASARADMAGWIDYMQLAKWHGRWVIVNVLWATRPEVSSARR